MQRIGAEQRYWQWLETNSVARIGRNAGTLVLVILAVAWLGDLSVVPASEQAKASTMRGLAFGWTALHTALAAASPAHYRRHYRWVLVLFMWIVGVMCAAIGTWANALQSVYLFGVVQAQFGYATFIPLRRSDMLVGTLGTSLLFLATPFVMGHALPAQDVVSIVTVLTIVAVLSLYAHHQLLSSRVTEHDQAQQLIAARDGLEAQVAERTEQLTHAVERLEASEASARELAQRVVSAREAESTRIARELHDELGQLLTGLGIGTRVLGRRLRKDAREDVAQEAERLGEIANDALQSVRSVTRELRPTMLDDLGLVAAVEALAQGFGARTGLTCRVEARIDEGPLDADQRTAIYRVAQEALTNVARHANATEVSIVLLQREAGIELVVEDNGVGVTELALATASGMGVRGMRERALSFDGTLEVTRVQPGTRVQLSLPTGGVL